MVALKNQWALGLAKKIKEALELRVNVKLLKEEWAMFADFGRSVRGLKRLTKLEESIAEALEKLVMVEGRFKKMEADVGLSVL